MTRPEVLSDVVIIHSPRASLMAQKLLAAYESKPGAELDDQAKAVIRACRQAMINTKAQVLAKTEQKAQAAAAAVNGVMALYERAPTAVKLSGATPLGRALMDLTAVFDDLVRSTEGAWINGVITLADRSSTLSEAEGRIFHTARRLARRLSERPQEVLGCSQEN